MPNGGQEFVAGRLLQEKAGGPSAKGVDRQVGIVVHREHDDFAVDALVFQTGEHVETGEPWHRQVRDDDVRTKPYGGIDELLAIVDGADHVNVAPSGVARGHR